MDATTPAGLSSCCFFGKSEVFCAYLDFPLARGHRLLVPSHGASSTFGKKAPTISVGRIFQYRFCPLYPTTRRKRGCLPRRVAPLQASTPPPFSPQTPEPFPPQDGSREDDTLKGIAAAGNGTFVLAGYTGGDLGGSNAGETDLVAVKLSSDGVVVWRWQVSLVFRSTVSSMYGATAVAHHSCLDGGIHCPPTTAATAAAAT